MRAPIALLTDFGYRDHYAGVMKGVIAAIAPGAAVIDLTHGIPPQAVSAGAIALAQSWRYFPARTIFVAVVDPGVGTDRRAIAAQTRAGARFVGPDNGLMWPALEAAGLEGAVELRAPAYRLAPLSATFHGRDLFAPAAAHLWRGVRLDSLGPCVSDLVKLAAPAAVIERRNELVGSVVYVDGFGNLITNIERARYELFAARFRGHKVSVRIGKGAGIKLLQAYGDAPVGAPIATFGSFEMLEVAVRDGSAAHRFAAGAGAPVIIRAARRPSDG